MKIQLADRQSFETLATTPSANIMRLTSFEAKYQENTQAYLHSHIAIPALGSMASELFMAKGVKHSVSNNIHIARSETMTMLRIVVPEDTTTGPASLYNAGHTAYTQLFNLINKRGLGTIARIWNYVPRILDDADSGLPQQDRERYRQFNAGRRDAWESFGPKQRDGSMFLPAATGIGSHNGPLVVECLITSDPVTYIENPRQIPAYNYPPKYGTKPPVFARGSLVKSQDQTELYISGTASIVGSSTRHRGNAIAQVKETFKNISTLIGDENLSNYNEKGFELSDIVGLRVYIKDRTQYLLIREEVEKIIGTDTPIVYVNDDICRPDLLLEIEGVAQRDN